MKVNFLNSVRSTLGGVVVHLLLAGVSLLLVCILYFTVYLPSITNHNRTIIVPDIEGKPLDQLELESVFVKSSLQYQVKDSSYSADYPALTVLKQYPPAGSQVKEGRKILLSVNQRNPPTVLVPDLIDGSVINAEAVLRSSQLQPGKIEIIPGPYKIVKEMRYHGQVVAASFPVPRGSVIDLIVMDGLSKDQGDTIP